MTNQMTNTYTSNLINVLNPRTTAECKRALDVTLVNGSAALVSRLTDYLGAMPKDIEFTAAAAAALYAPKPLTAQDAARAAAIKAQKKGHTREEIEVKVGRAIQRWEAATNQARLRYNLVAAIMLADVVEKHARDLKAEVDRLRSDSRNNNRKLSAGEKKALKRQENASEQGVILAEQVRSEVQATEAAAS